MKLCPVKGLMMNMCAVEGEASMGIRLDQVSSFCRPPISGYGEPTYLALAASASYSREREMAIWISMAAMGARIIMAMAAERAAAVFVIARCRRTRRPCGPA